MDTTGFTTENTVSGNPIEPTADTGEIAFDIVRETARGSSVLNRYCSNVRTQVRNKHLCSYRDRK